MAVPYIHFVFLRVRKVRLLNLSFLCTITSFWIYSTFFSLCVLLIWFFSAQREGRYVLRKMLVSYVHLNTFEMPRHWFQEFFSLLIGWLNLQTELHTCLPWRIRRLFCWRHVSPKNWGEWVTLKGIRRLNLWEGRRKQSKGTLSEDEHSKGNVAFNSLQKTGPITTS